MSDAAAAQDRTDARITELEIKLSYTEDLLDTLNALVARQQQDIAMLLRELVNLRQQGDAPGTGSPPNPRDELPPHY
jgi:SlyX protein